MIEDFFEDITILQQAEIQNQIGGRLQSWAEACTVKGVVNLHNASQSNISGKQGEQSNAKGFFAYSSNAVTYLKPQYRVQDGDGNIYKIIGQAKNTMGLNHHLRVDLYYETHLNG